VLLVKISATVDHTPPQKKSGFNPQEAKPDFFNPAFHLCFELLVKTPTTANAAAMRQYGFC